jgi:hypothetical protein
VNADELLDEVVVKGTRRWELRAAVIEAEDRLIARYNELNRDDDFDIHCFVHTPTGTHLSRRYCLSRLQDRAQQEDARALVLWATDTIIDPVTNQERHTNADPPVREVEVRMLERAEDYKKNLITLLQAHSDLRRLAKQHGDARRRYEAALPNRKTSKPKRAR